MVRETLKPWRQKFWGNRYSHGSTCDVLFSFHNYSPQRVSKNGEYLRSFLVDLILARELKRTIISKHSLTATRELKKKKEERKKKKALLKSSFQRYPCVLGRVEIWKC